MAHQLNARQVEQAAMQVYAPAEAMNASARYIASLSGMTSFHRIIERESGGKISAFLGQRQMLQSELSQLEDSMLDLEASLEEAYCQGWALGDPKTPDELPGASKITGNSGREGAGLSDVELDDYINEFTPAVKALDPEVIAQGERDELDWTTDLGANTVITGIVLDD